MQIDHIDGRKGVPRLPRDTLHRAVIAGAPGYQLLCANCNSIKRDENGEWHRRSRTRESEWDAFYEAQEKD